MKISKELVNGFIIVLGIALYFLLMQLLGLADIYLLRVFNVLFIFYVYWFILNTIQYEHCL